MVGTADCEPAASCSQSRRSNTTELRPGEMGAGAESNSVNRDMTPEEEPAPLPCNWWSRSLEERRPSGFQPDALTRTELRLRKSMARPLGIGPSRKVLETSQVNADHPALKVVAPISWRLTTARLSSGCSYPCELRDSGGNRWHVFQSSHTALIFRHWFYRPACGSAPKVVLDTGW